jgi:hypothetical protein
MFELVATVVAEQGPGSLQVNLVVLDELVTAPLDRPLLGERSPPGREDASRALPLAFLIAHLVALVRVAGDGGTATIQAMYHASLSRPPDGS